MWYCSLGEVVIDVRTKPQQWMAAPLHQLLVRTVAQGKKTQPVTWTEECQRAFETLKEVLITATVLMFADFSPPFWLYTDASLEGLRVVLAQIQEGRERVIAYTSQSLHPLKCNN
ncbi:hypothetical protein AAFF_G00367150 [Aldrovandia affinis]|uniref:Reverse transcriptase/retrotransposon-derived protein RNase H-like domain-containing protein n=1 Tax=Aldrovandia affinis TaxID=143900 RepID=A0AAD7SHI4_9TELE|nr:hypothetical protein AAFF_G00367150 [Aldrovandia affinis]